MKRGVKYVQTYILNFFYQFTKKYLLKIPKNILHLGN